MASHEVGGTLLSRCLFGIVSLHNLAIAGKSESWEAESVRQSLQDSWSVLTDAENENVRLLSRWLFHLEDGNYDLPAQLILKIDTTKAKD